MKIKRVWLLALLLSLIHQTLADDGDGTLSYYLSKSDLVVVGEVISNPEVVYMNYKDSMGLKHRGIAVAQPKLKICEVLKGDMRENVILSVRIERYISDAEEQNPWGKIGSKVVLYLIKRGGDEATSQEGEAGWKTADVWYGVQLHSLELVQALRRLAKK